MDDSRCIHQLDLCEQCGGLQVTTLTELQGVTEVQIGDDDGRTRFMSSGTRVFWSPGPEPCDPPPTMR